MHALVSRNTSPKPQPSCSASLIASLILLIVVAGAGCGSLSESGSGSFASVTIKNRSAEEIAAATQVAFRADGYLGGLTGSGQMVFEKAASRGTSLAREGVVAGIYGAQTIDRVRAEIVPVADGAYKLRCQAYMVTGGSDPFFQDEVPLASIRSGPCQSILNKVAKQLE